MEKNSVLLVEDDFEIANKLYKTTKELQSIAKVDLSTNLKESLEKLSSIKYDILILDLNLPDGNGIEILKWLRESQIHLKIYVFSLNIELKKKCLKLGAHSFFDKSNEFDFLIESLTNSTKLSN